MTEEQDLDKLAVEITALKEQAEEKLERAREEDGTFTPDDPATPTVDEAWVSAEKVEEPKPKKEKKKRERKVESVVEAKVEAPVLVKEKPKAPEALYGMAKVRAKFLNQR